MAKNGGFVVRCKEAEVLVPAKSTPHEIKELSDIDIQPDLRFHFPLIMFYRANPVMEGKDPVETIRKALANVLVWYYPYAGRVIEGPDGRLMVDCSEQGILFVEADADFGIADLGDTIRPPFSNTFDLLLPKLPAGSDGILHCPLLLVQVTRLSCGGFVVGTLTCHVISDALGFAQFLMATGGLAQRPSSSPSIIPIWKRQLLTAKYLNSANNPSERGKTITADGYDLPEYDVNGDGQNVDYKDAVHHSFFFGPKQIRAIRGKLRPHLRSISKFELITASLWRSRTQAMELSRDEKVIIMCAHNIRDMEPLVSYGGTAVGGFYGNAVVTSAAVAKAGELCDNPLEYAIELLRKSLGKVNEDYVKSVVNFIDMKGMPLFMKSRTLIISDTSRIGFHIVDFGWGKPVYGGPIDGGSVITSFYVNLRNNDGEDGVLLSAYLPPVVGKRWQWELKKLTAIEPGEFSERSMPKKIKSNL